jgi:hypothetical protein
MKLNSCKIDLKTKLKFKTENRIKGKRIKLKKRKSLLEPSRPTKQAQHRARQAAGHTISV